jgi:hypothetical protein
LKPDAALFVDSILGSLPRVLAAPFELEMSALIRQRPEKNFVRKL